MFTKEPSPKRKSRNWTTELGPAESQNPAQLQCTTWFYLRLFYGGRGPENQCEMKKEYALRMVIYFPPCCCKMAHQEMAPSPSANNFSTAINLLWQAKEILSSSENENHSSSSAAARPSSSSARSHDTTPPPDQDSAVMADFRNLFSPYAASTSSSLPHTQKPSRPPKRGSQPSPYYRPNETRTHDFFGLPNRIQKLQLKAAGLGRKKWFSGTKTE